MATQLQPPKPELIAGEEFPDLHSMMVAKLCAAKKILAGLPSKTIAVCCWYCGRGSCSRRGCRMGLLRVL